MQNKTGQFKKAVAKTNGYYTPRGERLKAGKFTQQQCDEWNGVKAVTAIVVEEEVEMCSAPVVESAPAPKKSKGKKKQSFMSAVKNKFS